MRRAGRSTDLLGDVYCLSVDPSLESPFEKVRDSRWSIEVARPGMPDVSIPLDSSRSTVSIGRSRDNDLVILDPHVSRHHACIEYSEEELWVRDLDSKNMTYLDGIPLLGTKRLGDGVELRIGTARLHAVRTLASPASAAVP